MVFNLNFPTQDSGAMNIQLQTGETLFVLGANGSGKTSLMHLFATQNQGVARTIWAYRQNWMGSDGSEMTHSQKKNAVSYISQQDKAISARYRDAHAQQRTSIAIFDLIVAVNERARKVAAAADVKDEEAIKSAKEIPSPLAILNELLQRSNLPIELSLGPEDQVLARRDGGPAYGGSALSDGERNALIVASNVLTAPKGSLLIIDEPERHLHRSITAPLLRQLLEQRPDCGFVVSTHDHDLPLDVPDGRILLLRSCQFAGEKQTSWVADELPTDADIGENIKKDLLGARRKVLFVEGTTTSLDLPLYSLIFPMVSVVPKGNCHEVESAVIGSRAGKNLHWLDAFGIADGDALTAAQIQEKRQQGIYIVPYYSVEAIYYHPNIVSKISERQSHVSGENSKKRTEEALEGAVTAVSKHADRLSRNAAKKSVREHIMSQIPNDDDLLAGSPLSVVNEAKKILDNKRSALKAAIDQKDWDAILKETPIRECEARAVISEKLGFRKHTDYEQAVRNLFTKDVTALHVVRGLFGDLFHELRK